MPPRVHILGEVAARERALRAQPCTEGVCPAVVDVTVPWTVLAAIIVGAGMMFAGSVVMHWLNRTAGVMLMLFGCGIIIVVLVVNVTAGNAENTSASDMQPAAGSIQPEPTTWRECADAAMDAATERFNALAFNWVNIKLDYDLALCDRAFPEEGGKP